jgi:6-phosphogluconolactonase (cycloisomerase 2 family)
MNFQCTARAARRSALAWLSAALLFLAAILISSCGGSSSSSHLAYITVPLSGAVSLVKIDDKTGGISLGATTPTQVNASPSGLALHPSKKFLYVLNSASNSISIYNVAGDGSLTLSGTPTPSRSGPTIALIDDSGQFLLVSNSFTDTISVFQMDSGSGAITEVTNSPFPAGPENDLPTDMKMHGNTVYVAHPNSGTVTMLSLDTSGTLTLLPQSPIPAKPGARNIAVSPTGQFLFTANITSSNISAFTINSDGSLTNVPGSPFTSTATTGTTTNNNGPSVLATDPSGKFLYVATVGSTASLWVFSIDPNFGVLREISGSPFSLAGGNLFLLMDPNGTNFYIGDQTSGAAKIAEYTFDANSGVPTAVSGSPFSVGASMGQMVFSP